MTVMLTAITLSSMLKMFFHIISNNNFLYRKVEFNNVHNVCVGLHNHIIGISYIFILYYIVIIFA